MSTPARDAAVSYLRAGFSVIPTRGADKRPLLAWREFGTRRPSEAEILAWWRRWPDAGVAIVCGAVSGLVVMDGDPRNGDGLPAIMDRLPPTPTVETGGGGRHYYFAANGARVPKIPALLPGMDLQAEASYIIAPPSIHPSGRHYRWFPGLVLGEVPLTPLPPFIRHLIALHQHHEEEPRPRRSTLLGSRLTLDAVLFRLRGVRRCGRGWVALCPAHDDREQSLSIAGGGGKVLLHCFAGCPFSEILSALRREAA